MPHRRRGEAAERRRTGRIRFHWLVLSAAAGIAVYAVAAYEWRASSFSALPLMPTLTRMPSAVREHVRERYAAAGGAPSTPVVVGALCVALHADMFLDEAQRCYELAERLAPSDWRWSYYRALILSERGGGDPFVGALREVLARVPTFGPAWLRLGDAEFKRGRYDAATEAWTRTINMENNGHSSGEVPAHEPDAPISAYASLGLARVALARNDANGARQILERVTARNPRFGSAFRLLAESNRRLGRSADADRARARADRLPAYAPYADPMVDTLARESRNSTFLLRQASEADLATSSKWSEFLVRRALEFDPDNPDVLSKLGRVLRNLGRNEEALEVLTEYSRKVPGDYQGYAQVGSCLSDLGRYDEAERNLRRALEGTDDGRTRYNLGIVLAATNREDDAVVEYRRALQIDASDVGARNNLAAVLARQGKLDQAKQELEQVLRLDPENALAHTNLAIIRTNRR